MRAHLSGFAATGALCALLAATSVASAGPAEDKAAARDHLNQAQELKKAGQLAEAVPHLAEAARLDPKLPTFMELAETAEQAGQLVEAQGYWAAARDRAKKEEKPQSRAKAEERLAAVEKRVARLTLQLVAGTPANVQVLRDDAPVDAAVLANPLLLNPGDHTVAVKLEGHDDAKYAVKLAEGDNQTLAIAAGPATAKAAPPPPPPPPPPKPVAQPTQDEGASSGSGQRTAGIIMGAAGLAGIIIGAPLWFIGYRDSNSLGPTADQQLLTGQICVIGGGVLLATGAVLVIAAPSGDAPKSGGVRIAPSLSLAQNATMVGAVGAF